MSLSGKGMYIWRAANCESGSPQAIASRARAAGLSYVLLKVADGVQPYDSNHAPGIVSALRSAGIGVWGWQYVYGDSPREEADVAASLVSQLRLDGLVVNAEREYEGKFSAAEMYMERMGAALVGTPLALASFRFPEYHPSFPWTEFLSQCAWNMPQIFWVNSHDPAGQLEHSLEQFQSIYPVVPVLPTGAAYEDSGWRPSASEIQELVQAAQQKGLDGVNFWNWDYAGSPQGSDLWQAVAAVDWGGHHASGDSVEALFDALNRADVDAIVKLYEPDGVLVTPSNTVRGPYELWGYYMDLLNNILPHGQFAVVSRANEAGVEHVVWDSTSLSATRKVSGAQDTIGLRGGLIKYHTSLYHVA